MAGQGNGLERSAIQGQEILLGLTQVGKYLVDCQLIHHMAHFSTETRTDDDVRWLQEMKRLHVLGAPLFEEELDGDQ
jgi:hypothetical protein